MYVGRLRTGACGRCAWSWRLNERGLRHCRPRPGHCLSSREGKRRFTVSRKSPGAEVLPDRHGAAQMDKGL